MLTSLFTGASDGFMPQAPSDLSNPLRINQYALAEPVGANGGLGGIY